MRKRIDNWMNGKVIELQEAVSRKSQGMGTVEIILIIVFICLIK